MSAGRVRVGVVGAGWWAQRVHLPELARHGAADVVVVCDAIPERAHAAAAACGARIAIDVSDVIAAGVDAVVVATPHDQHTAAAEPLLAAGVDVLVEKPLALHPREAWKLVRTARQSGARLHTGFTYVHGLPARQLRDLVAGGRIGELTLATAVFGTAVHRLYEGDVTWQRTEEGATVPSLPDTYSTPSRGGGQLWAQTVHAISLLLWTSGLVPRDVSAVHDHADLPVDVSNALAVRFTSGTVGTIASSGIVRKHANRVEEYRFFGLDGHALLDTAHGLLTVSPPDGEPTEMRWDSEDVGNPVGAPVRCLVDAVLGRSEVVADGELGAWTTAVAWAAARAAGTGRRVRVPGPEDEADEGR